MTMTAKVTGVDASYYYVKDLERATAFYTKTLGFEPTSAHPEMFAEWTFADGSSFGVYKAGEGEFRAGGSVMFAVDDVHAALEAAKALGAPVQERVEETPVCSMGFAQDTEGNSFILHKRK